MSLARKDHLRQAQDSQVISHDENRVLYAIVTLSLHANHLFSAPQAGCAPTVSNWPIR